MRAILFALVSLCLLAGSSPAQQLNNDEKIFTGSIDSVGRTRGAAPLWTYAKITIVSDTGEKLDCFLMSSTVFIDADGTSHEAGQPDKSKRVEIKYVTITGGSSALDGQNAAVSLHYLN
jgi:hypothetical protein